MHRHTNRAVHRVPCRRTGGQVPFGPAPTAHGARRKLPSATESAAKARSRSRGTAAARPLPARRTQRFSCRQPGSAPTPPTRRRAPRSPGAAGGAPAGTAGPCEALCPPGFGGGAASCVRKEEGRAVSCTGWDRGRMKGWWWWGDAEDSALWTRSRCRRQNQIGAAAGRRLTCACTARGGPLRQEISAASRIGSARLRCGGRALARAGVAGHGVACNAEMLIFQDINK